MRIGFGRAPSEVGLIDDVHHASIPVFPESFTVAPDGSFWLVDEVKHRLAHYSDSGRYLGQIGGIRFDRFHPQPQDLLSVGDSLFLLEQDHQHFLLSSVREFRAGREVASAQANDGQGSVIVNRLVSGPTELIGLTAGLAGDPIQLGQGAKGYATLSLRPPPNVSYVDGLPVNDRTRIAGEFDPNHLDDRYLISLASPEVRSIVPVRFVVTTDASEHARHLQPEVGVQIQAVLPDRIVAWVPLSPSRPADADRYGGGTWLFEFPIDGSPLVWERLPEPGLSSEAQVRYFAAGPNGALYYLHAERDGMVISEVPTT
jgi:hypothetical protein